MQKCHKSIARFQTSFIQYFRIEKADNFSADTLYNVFQNRNEKHVLEYESEYRDDPHPYRDNSLRRFRDEQSRRSRDERLHRDETRYEKELGNHTLVC